MENFNFNLNFNINLNNNQDNSNETIESEIIDAVREFTFDLESKINGGKIINMESLNKDITLLIQGVQKYNNYMEEWYDEQFKNDTETFNNILKKFNQDSFTFKELSLISNN